MIMKLLRYILLFAVLGFYSCEEVVRVDLNTAAPRLVIDASIDWIQGTDGSVQKIKLTTTTGFYEPEVPAVSNAQVTVENQNGQIFTFLEEGNSGEYFCYDFVPEIGMTYTLKVIIGEDVYTATETLFPAPQILYFEQNNDIGFGDDIIEVKYFFQDNPDQNNYYMDRIKLNNKAYPFYDIMDDRFTQGNEMFGLFLSDEIKAGDTLHLRMHEISGRYYYYMDRLLEVADNGGLFQTNVGVVRGNIVNQTNPQNYALGYFRLCEVYETNYIVE